MTRLKNALGEVRLWSAAMVAVLASVTVVENASANNIICLKGRVKAVMVGYPGFNNTADWQAQITKDDGTVQFITGTGYRDVTDDQARVIYSTLVAAYNSNAYVYIFAANCSTVRFGGYSFINEVSGVQIGP